MKPGFYQYLGTEILCNCPTSTYANKYNLNSSFVLKMKIKKLAGTYANPGITWSSPGVCFILKMPILHWRNLFLFCCCSGESKLPDSHQRSRAGLGTVQGTVTHLNKDRKEGQIFRERARRRDYVDRVTRNFLGMFYLKTIG